jgi:catechol 2,3-dioxygenase-like lactoylglutathione lyase family enzyme
MAADPDQVLAQFLDTTYAAAADLGGWGRASQEADPHRWDHQRQKRPDHREETPMMDRDDLPAPRQGLVVTHFLTVRDIAVSRKFYADIFGGYVVLDENPAIVRIANSWIIMNPGGGPTPDKPDITLTPPEPGDPVSAFLNIRVADIAAFYTDARAKGAYFLTEPLDRKAELRCYLRDPDGYLIEIGQATGMLYGVFADPPASS